jgi:hypothetical protein
MNVLSLPKLGLIPTRFEPVRLKDVARMGGRRTEVRFDPHSYWVADYSTQTPHLADIAMLDAFVMRLESGDVFRAYDTTRPRPLAHLRGPLAGSRAGGGAFDGTASLTAITSSIQVTVGGLPPYFQFSPGDYAEIRMSSLIVSLHRIMSAVTASSSGSATLSIRHGLDLDGFTTAATVNFEKPSCLMQMTTGSYSAGRRRGGRGASFSAQEVFFS